MFVFDLIFLIVFVLGIVSQPSRIGKIDLSLPKVNADVLKSILPLGIIIFHLKINWIGNWSGSLIVGCFLFMSGYGMMYKIDKSGVWWKDVANSLIKVGGPWAFMVLMYQAVKFLRLGHLYPHTTMSLASRGDFELLLPYSWFCIALVVFYLITFLGGLFKRKSLRYLSIALLLLCYCLFVVKILGWELFWINTAICYFIGCLWYDYMRGLKVRGAMVLLLTLFLMVVLNLVHDKVPQGIVSDCLIAMTATIAMIMLGTQMNAEKYLEKKWCSFLIKYSYWLYLCHGVSQLILNPSRVRSELSVGIENDFLLIIAQYTLTFVLAFVCGSVYNRLFKQRPLCHKSQ